MIIQTTRLSLISGDVDILQSAIDGDETLSIKLNVVVADGWTEFGPMPLRYSLDMLAKDPEEQKWLTYFTVLKDKQILIGFGGYKGKPADGIVELGYEIAPDYRGHGFATEYAQALIVHAFKEPNVQMVIAHTLAHENPSTSILKKLGFAKIEEINDPEDGLIWRWELKKV